MDERLIVLLTLIVIFLPASFALVNELKSLKERIQLLKIQTDLVYKMAYDTKTMLGEADSVKSILEEVKRVKADILEAENFWNDHLTVLESRLDRLEKRLDDDVK